MNKKAKNRLAKDLKAKNKKSKVQKSKKEISKDIKAKVLKSKSLISKRWFSIGIQKIKVQCKEITARVVPISQKNGYISIYLEPEVVQTWIFEGMDDYMIGSEIKSNS